MKKKSKISVKITKFIFLVLLAVFTTIYISGMNGRYEYEQSRKVALTQEKIEQFELDVKSGKKINVDDYLENTTPNYQNKTSQLGLNISENIGKYISVGIKKIFKKLNKLVED